MFIQMPSGFPQDKFQQFGKQATDRLPGIFDADPIERRQHFVRAWMAVQYRYRSCSEYNEEFKSLFRGASEDWSWRVWNENDEQHYKLDRCLYGFFVTALSVFESFGFCLYFAGAAIWPQDFSLVAEPRKIDLRSVAEAFRTVLPEACITRLLWHVLSGPEFRKLKDVRNILMHRVAGRRSIRGEIDVSVGAGRTQRRGKRHGTCPA